MLINASLLRAQFADLKTVAEEYKKRFDELKSALMLESLLAAVD